MLQWALVIISRAGTLIFLKRIHFPVASDDIGMYISPWKVWDCDPPRIIRCEIQQGEYYILASKCCFLGRFLRLVGLRLRRFLFSRIGRIASQPLVPLRLLLSFSAPSLGGCHLSVGNDHSRSDPPSDQKASRPPCCHMCSLNPLAWFLSNLRVIDYIPTKCRRGVLFPGTWRFRR